MPDAALWARAVPALRRRLSVRAAIAAIAVRAGARAEPVGAQGWRLRPAPPAAPRRPHRARPAAPVRPDGDIIVTASKRDTT